MSDGRKAAYETENERHQAEIMGRARIESGWAITVSIHGIVKILAVTNTLFGNLEPKLGDYMILNGFDEPVSFQPRNEDPTPEAPMDNNKQAVDIKGYRVLSQKEKDSMNHLKQQESIILQQLEEYGKIPGVNQRSLAIAKTEIQTGFMWANRAIARPNGE